MQAGDAAAAVDPASPGSPGRRTVKRKEELRAKALSKLPSATEPASPIPAAAAARAEVIDDDDDAATPNPYPIDERRRRLFEQLDALRFPEWSPDVVADMGRALPASTAMAPGFSREVAAFLRQRGTLLAAMDQLATTESVMESFSKTEEFLFCPIFSPDFIDACVTKGVFPMTCRIGMGITAFAAKLHKHRAVVPVLSAAPAGTAAAASSSGPAAPSSGAETTGLSIPTGSRKSAGKYIAIIDGHWDECVAIINKQHGEDWLTPALRKNFYEMFLKPDKYKARLCCLAIVSKDRLKESRGIDLRGPLDAIVLSDVPPSAIVAAELGYIVGDIYTSLTGAYREAGAGAVQLATLAALLKLGGFHTWDLGMMMPYKEKSLGATLLPRKRWVQLAQQRREEVAKLSTSSSSASTGTHNSSFKLGRGTYWGKVVDCRIVIDVAFPRGGAGGAEGAASPH